MTSVLVLGAGSIGRRHLRNLGQLAVQQLAVCDNSADRLAGIESDVGVTSFLGYDSALKDFKPASVVICTPPHSHLKHAHQALLAGAHVFVEKPLSDSSTGVADLRAAAIEADRTVQVGYNLRFHRGLTVVKELVERRAVGKVLWSRAEFGQYLPDWRPSQDYRQSYTARRELGGGILLDASHEFDYLMWLLGRPQTVSCLAGKVSTLEVDVEDSASVLLRFADGSHADVHLDFLQRQYSRSCKLVCEQGTILWDYPSQQVRIFYAGAKDWEVQDVFTDPNDMYLAEMERFLCRVSSGDRSMAGLDAAADVLRLVDAAKSSAAEGRVERLQW